MELPKTVSKPIQKALQELVDSVTAEGRTLNAWNISVVIIFFKQGDKPLPKIYRAILLQSHVYKLFSRVIPFLSRLSALVCRLSASRAS